MPTRPLDLVRVASADRTLDRRLLDARGGFAWWYLDALNAQGDGVVVIWSYGLPFLPRRGRRTASPRERPSLNVAVYRGGREAFYLLQEYPADEASWSPDGTHWRFGRSTIQSRVERDRRRVDLRLDCAVPGGEDRLRGRIRLDGAARMATAERRAPTLDDHDWSPLTGPASVRARLRVGDRSILAFDGRGYHDRNGSRTPLERLGIRHWIWGRVAASDRELIYYLAWPPGDAPPQTTALEVAADGSTRVVPIEARLGRRRFARWGMPYWDAIELREGGRSWLEIRHRALLDDGPFYLRFSTEARTAEGATAHGSGELVRPGRIDFGPLRPLVRMRVHHTGMPCSRFAPLFSGPRETRLARQVRALLPSTPARLLPLLSRG